jgi:hypothetical protein
MTIEVSADTIRATLAAQGYAVSTDAAAAIAATLSAQLNSAAPAYAALKFEAEPAGFAALLNGGAGR